LTCDFPRRKVSSTRTQTGVVHRSDPNARPLVQVGEDLWQPPEGTTGLTGKARMIRL